MQAEAAAVWATALAALAALLYWHLTATFGHWRRRGVPHHRPLLFFGNMKDRIFFRTSFHEFQRRLYFDFEGHEVAGVYEGRRPTLLVREPRLIRDVLLRHFDKFADRPLLRTAGPAYIQRMLITLPGRQWKRVRAALTPAFSTGKIRSMEGLVRLCGRQLSAFLDRNMAAAGGVELEMKELYGRFTMDVIASCAFGVQCDSLAQPDAEFAATAARFNDMGLPKRLLLFAIMFVIPAPLHRFMPVTFFNPEVMEFLAGVVRETRQARESSAEPRRADFLQLLIEAAQREQQEAAPGAEPVLDEVTVTAQAILFLLAGFETSSTVLTFACYELAQQPELQARARREVREQLRRHGGQCCYEALQDMAYLENVLLEAMRLHPPLARVDRVCTAECALELAGGRQLPLRPGETLAVSAIGLHCDPRYWPQPHRFDPDRFLPEARQQRSPYVFMAFGEGPRNCIGKRFAMLSTKLAMAYLLKDFSLKPSPKTKIPFEYSKFSMLLKAEGGIWLNIERLDSESE